MGVHTGLLFVLAIAYWNPICQSVRNLEREEGLLLHNDYQKFYKTCLAGLFLMIVVLMNNYSFDLILFWLEIIILPFAGNDFSRCCSGLSIDVHDIAHNDCREMRYFYQ